MRIARMAALMVAAIFSLAAGKPHPNWTATVTVAQHGAHVLGNPDAPIKLTEFVSYTCSHCAVFQKQSEAPLRLAYVTPGKVSVTVQHLLRDNVDLTVAMLTNCGDPKGFFERHHTFLHQQDKWLGKMESMSEAQRQRWTNGDMGARLQAVASDFDFYTLMRQRGYTRSQVNQCLADEAQAQRLLDQTQDAVGQGVKGTPSFALNGSVLPGIHSWEALDKQIKAQL